MFILETVQLKVVSTTTIEKGPEEQTKTIHETVRLDCVVLWDPTYTLTVEWKKDNVDVKKQRGYGDRITVDKASIANQALTIRDLNYDDAGNLNESVIGHYNNYNQQFVRLLLPLFAQLL